MSARTLSLTGADGNGLVADVHGAGSRSVLLLHGGGQTRHAWEATGARLAARGLSAWCLDQRGHGGSDWIESGAYEFRDFARDVVAVSDQIAGRSGVRPVGIGASLGGIASLLAEGQLRPGTLSALVLVDVTPRMDPAGVNKVISFMADRAEAGFATVEEAADAIARYLPHRKRPERLDGLAKNLRLHDDGRYRWHWDPRFLGDRRGRPVHPEDGIEESVEDELVRAARALTIPVLLVRGARSELVTQSHVDEFLTLVPHAEYADVADAGHMVAGDRNDAFAGAVVTFLDRLKAA